MFVSTFRNIRKNYFKVHSEHISTTSMKFNKDDQENGNKNKSPAVQKLDALLKSLIQVDLTEHTNKEKELKIEIPKPKKNFQKRIDMLKENKKKENNLGEKIVLAAKEVAKVVEGDRKENEVQLLQKLLFKDTPLKDEITNAYSSSPTLKELITGMKIEKEEKVAKSSPPESLISRADQVRNAIGRREAMRPLSKPPSRMEEINIFDSKPLGIFKKDVPKATKPDVTLETWEYCHKRDLRLAITHPPSNIYEQMIQWTDRGILWKFPIDNEQEMEVEKQTSFSDHVFLETHLEGWCPSRGPIRHFMELVCVGLSKNYWLSAEEKKQHMLWYRDYFSSKKEMIKEIGAGEIASSPEMAP